MTELCRLAEKHGTDKLGVYTPFYDSLLGPRSDFITAVLEVGIGTPEAMPHVKDYKAGASLRMWRDYFRRASIVGIDINQNAVSEAKEDRIHTLQGDSRQIELRGLYDLVIDDGSHDPKDQLDTFDNLFCRVSAGGLYIIEDVEEYALRDKTLSLNLPEHTIIQHVHGEQIGRCIVVQA